MKMNINTNVMLTDFCLVLYPLYESYHSAKKPRISTTKHWLIFWQLWVILHFIDVIICKIDFIWTWIPFSNIIVGFYHLGRVGIIIGAYNSKVTYILYKGLFTTVYKEVKKMSRNKSIDVLLTDILHLITRYQSYV
jgi:hypothetical protein